MTYCFFYKSRFIKYAFVVCAVLYAPLSLATTSANQGLIEKESLDYFNDIDVSDFQQTTEDLELDKINMGKKHHDVLLATLELLNRGEVEKAILITRILIDNGEQAAPAYEVYGAALAINGDTDKALQKLQKAVDISPEQHSSITKMGDIYYALGNFKESKKKYLQSSKIDSTIRVEQMQKSTIKTCHNSLVFCSSDKQESTFISA
ncbi:hypothetical protein [Methyloprofundus sp.]|uniref:hypothetical protein n=1 Tax=Methyloprofundus sp. TaxID=2020875 RepID=UPI003D14D1E9